MARPGGEKGIDSKVKRSRAGRSKATRRTEAGRWCDNFDLHGSKNDRLECYFEIKKLSNPKPEHPTGGSGQGAHGEAAGRGGAGKDEAPTKRFAQETTVPRALAVGCNALTDTPSCTGPSCIDS